MNLFKILHLKKRKETNLNPKIIMKEAELLLRQINSSLCLYLPGFENKWLILKCDEKELKEVIKIFYEVLPKEVNYSRKLKIKFSPYNENYGTRLVYLEFSLGDNSEYIWKFDLFELMVIYLNSQDRWTSLLEIKLVIDKFIKFVLLNIENIYILD